MGNNRNCDVCAGNTRNQMDMRRQKAAMYERYNNCDDCRRTRDELSGMPLAMGYVPWQNFECTYEPAQGLRAGTIFPELDKPFYGRRGMR